MTAVTYGGARTPGTAVAKSVQNELRKGSSRVSWLRCGRRGASKLAAQLKGMRTCCRPTNPDVKAAGENHETLFD